MAFAELLGRFLQNASDQRDRLAAKSKETERQLFELAAFLGEPRDVDPATVLSTLWKFVLTFDSAFTAFAKRA